MNTQEKENLIYTFMVAGAVIKNEGKFLLVQEKKPNVYGLWNLPAGKVEKGYTIEETAIKEAKEESGFDVEIIRKLGVFQENENKPVKHSFEAKIIAGELQFPEDEILDAKWFTIEELEGMKDQLRGDWVLESIKMAN